MSDKIQKFAPIAKVEDNDDGSVTIFGVASTEAVDAHGEIVTKSAMENALPDFLKYGTGALRAMHQPIAAGVVTKATVNAAGETEIEAIVVDPVEVAKVKAGVYKGLSIGGSKLPGGYDAISKTITAMKLTEISLVDRPANPEATISMWKFEDEPAATATVSADQADAAAALADLLNKGDVSAARLVELAQAEIAKGAEPVAVEPAPVVEPIAKGMYSVSRFAELIQSIGYLVSDAEWEADCEKDGSPVPAQLREWLTAGAAVFQAMAVEEINEFITQFQTPESTSAAVVSLDVELSDQATTLRKSLDEAAGSGLAGYLSIAKAHMPEDDVARMVLADGYEKATTVVLERLAPGNDAVLKLADANITIAKLQGERDELAAKIAKFEAAPAAPKGVLRVVVEKGADITELAGAPKDEPIKKADGSVDHEATAMAAIRKLHQTGGQPLRAFIPS